MGWVEPEAEKRNAGCNWIDLRFAVVQHKAQTEQKLCNLLPPSVA